jgi:hypothetical protein
VKWEEVKALKLFPLLLKVSLKIIKRITSEFMWSDSSFFSSHFPIFQVIDEENLPSSTTPAPNSPSLVSEEEIEKAYQRGYQEANLQLDQKINYLANEVYESVQGHLDQFQKQKIEQSNQEVCSSFFTPFLIPTSPFIQPSINTF